ncbi:MAG: hypothetical protein H6730_30710 [Deltaproteobacteria bacterium]|nr:hypothetical protein [Deltaproteobacteria bacterium]
MRLELFDPPRPGRPDGIVSGDILVSGAYVAFMSSPTSAQTGASLSEAGGKTIVEARVKFGARSFKSGRSGKIELDFSSKTAATMKLECASLGIDETVSLKRKDRYFRDMTIEIDKVAAATFPVKVRHNGEDWTLDGIFKEAGINARVRRSQRSIEDKADGWSEADLYEALRKYRMENRGPWHVHVLVTSRLDEAEGSDTLGWMYDEEPSPGDPPREGCAVFFDALKDYVEQAHSDSSDAVRAREYLLTTAHEIGHALNLVHSWVKGRADSPSVMNYPEEYDYGPDAYYTDLSMRFDDKELEHIRHHSREVTEPGHEQGTAFGDDPFRRVPRIPKSLSRQDPSARRQIENIQAARVGHRSRLLRQLELELVLESTTVLTNEPLFGEVKLRLAEAKLDADLRLLRAAFALDWKAGHLLVEIRRPGESWRRVQALTKHCSHARTRSLKAGEELRVELPIVATRAKKPLLRPGTYELRIVAKVGYRSFIHDVPSRPVTITVRAPATPEERMVVRSLAKLEVRKYIALGGFGADVQTLNDVRDLSRVAPNLTGSAARLALARRGDLTQRSTPITGVDLVERLATDATTARFLGKRTKRVLRDLSRRHPSRTLPR